MKTNTVAINRVALVATRGVTLDGKPARISGVRNDFATVTDRGTGLSAEWSWQAVARIVARGGDFKS